jgi:cytochrome c-type biogenesis protein CcmF
MVLLFVGWSGLAFRTESKATMGEGDLMRINDYMLRCQTLTEGEDPNYIFQRAVLTVTKGGRALGVMNPERRLYKASQESISHVAIHSTPAEDLYVVVAGADSDSGKAIVEAFVNPLVAWVWLGGAVVFWGTLLAMVPSRVEREMAEIRRQREEAVAEDHVL